MKRWDVINLLIKKFQYKSYLEIGIRNGTCIVKVDCKNKLGVDSAPQINMKNVVVKISDDFFKENKRIFDCVFIDGLHHDEQVERDILNSLNCLSENGTIILHDCNPPDEASQQVPRIQSHWNGDVWKAWVNFRANHSDRLTFTIDTDEGLGIIHKGKLVSIGYTTDFKEFFKNKKEYLNLISISEFQQWIKFAS